MADRITLYMLAPAGRLPREGEWSPVIRNYGKSALVCDPDGIRKHVEEQRIADDGTLLTPGGAPLPARLDGWEALP